MALRGQLLLTWVAGLVLCACAPIAPKPSPTVVAATRTIPPTATATAAPIATPTASSVPATPTATSTPTTIPTPTTTGNGRLIAIDPGHGGEDLGARHFAADGSMDFSESEVNLDLALRLRALLEARGYGVLLTRDGDYGLNPDLEDVNGNGLVDHVDDLQVRLDAINTAGADLLLSIHQNAFFWPDGESAEDVGGTITFYCSERPFSERNRLLADLVHEQILLAFADLGYPILDRGVERDEELDVSSEGGGHLIVLGPQSDRSVRPSQMPGVLSETMFISNSQEARLARQPEAIDRLALAYALAIDAYWQNLPAD
jgi:N-acetylmuramoyl-L-alanine amidase